MYQPRARIMRKARLQRDWQEQRMTALLTRLANMKTDLNIWFDRLSNWQFVTVAAPITFCIIAVTDYVVALATGYGNLSLNISYDLTFTVVFTAFMAWRRRE